jgi:hypothetical protein
VTKPPFVDPYYPSPEMHEDAADALEEVCRKLAAPAEGLSPASAT